MRQEEEEYLEEVVEELRAALEEMEEDERIRRSVEELERRRRAKWVARWRWRRALEEGVYWVGVARWTGRWREAWRRLEELKEVWGREGVEAFRREEERRMWQ